MGDKIVRKIFHIDGMTCASCEMRIENVLNKLDGMVEAKAMYGSSNVYLTYEVNKLGLNKIIESIEKLGYKVSRGIAGACEKCPGEKSIPYKSKSKMSFGQFAGVGIIIFAIYIIIRSTIGFNFIPQVDQSMGYGILFVTGLLTSLHCLAMCGGINLSVCMQYRVDKCESEIAKLKPSVLYNLGRVFSYTVIGGIVGAVGSVASLSGTAKGIITILSGIFMVITGLNMLNIFPWLRKLNLRMPRFPSKNIKNINNNTGKKGPFIVGVLNGLMPCGPLQAVQLYALGTGSFAAGALSMFLFSSGTVPVMLGFGAVSSLLSAKLTSKMMKASSVLVVILGIIMLNRGLSLSGYNFMLASGSPVGLGNTARVENSLQLVTTKLESGRYPPIVVKKGVPVKWTIKADKENLNGCNNAITAKEFGIENRELNIGVNIIEFTPNKEGTFVYSCWMGMLHSYIKVVDNDNKANSEDGNSLTNDNN